MRDVPSVEWLSNGQIRKNDREKKRSSEKEPLHKSTCCRPDENSAHETSKAIDGNFPSESPNPGRLEKSYGR